MARYRRRFVRRVASRTAQRHQRRTLGRWHVFTASVELALGNSGNVADLLLPEPEGGHFENEDAITIYSLDSVISLTFKHTRAGGDYNSPPIHGVLVGFKHDNASQTPLSQQPKPVMTTGPEALKGPNTTPWRFWYNWVLAQQSVGWAQRSVTIPFRFMNRAKSLTLRREQGFYLRLQRYPTGGEITSAMLEMRWSGRYRFLVKPS